MKGQRIASWVWFWLLKAMFFLSCMLFHTLSEVNFLGIKQSFVVHSCLCYRLMSFVDISTILKPLAFVSSEWSFYVSYKCSMYEKVLRFWKKKSVLRFKWVYTFWAPWMARRWSFPVLCMDVKLLAPEPLDIFFHIYKLFCWKWLLRFWLNLGNSWQSSPKMKLCGQYIRESSSTHVMNVNMKCQFCQNQIYHLEGFQWGTKK